VNEGTEWPTVLERNLAVVQRMADGISHEQSLIRPIDGGSSFNWLLGHMVVSRDRILGLLGGQALAAPEVLERYPRGSHPPGRDDAVPFEQLLELFAAQGAALEAAIANVDAATLAAARATGSSSVGEFVGFLVWHEAYHAGQAVLYRRGAGLDSPIG